MAQDTAVKAAPAEKFREDYRAPDHDILELELDFGLFDDHALVRASMSVARAAGADAGSDLSLDGEDLELLRVELDGAELRPGAYRLDGERLVIPAPPASFRLVTEVRIKPQENTQLSGLYRSADMFCTQCEAEGFRRITFFPDRPDVMTRYHVRVEADRARFPVLLSNGNLVEQGEAGGGRHYTVWEDPFKKPSYLFALVAGDLGHIEDRYTTLSGRQVLLRVWSEHENTDRLAHALRALMNSMKWDERVYGREYDLDVFNIVAVNDFNMGAMENKSLNVFNSAYVLAKAETATDQDFDLIEGVVGHEYFHNWTGNRVTCRDWFQLTLKEGLTVFRDQQFSADMASAAVKRIEDVRVLRRRQFPEDAGPMAHPVRPESYIAMDNFYTVTVYNKGAEVIRMYHTLLGAEGFREGMDLYFERHDGQAVSCDDFRAAMADANGADLAQFERWYLQAGTPVVEAECRYRPDSGEFEIELRQSCPATPKQPEKLPFHIPVAVGLIGADGRDLPLVQEGAAGPCQGPYVLELRQAVQRFVFTGLSERPVPSLLRGYSAPVKLRLEQDDEQLAFLLAHDSDSFNRWEAGQKLYQRVLLSAYAALSAGGSPQLPETVLRAWRSTLAAEGIDASLQAYALIPPDEATLAEEVEQADPALLHQAREWLLGRLAAACRSELEDRYAALAPSGPFRHDPAETGRRRLRNLCLEMLSRLPESGSDERCLEQFRGADNMTDQEGALQVLASSGGDAREVALAAFLETWRQDPLVMDKWLAIQAGADLADTVERVTALLQHPVFEIKNPNKARALVRSFSENLPHFHRADGAGYRFLADRVLELDPLNPQISARLVQPLGRWRRMEPALGARMKQQLERIAAHEGVSKDLFEIVQRSLAG
ncbi:MAG: aminopeptidase N [Planctomycetes bacterium]|nr:aminopeptidase N [Planctomycetota bacterium]